METMGPMVSHISSQAPSGEAEHTLTVEPSFSVDTTNSGALSEAFVTSLVNVTPESFFQIVL